MDDFPSNWGPLQIIEYLERTHVYKNVSRYGDSYIAVKKGESQMQRDRERAALIRQAIGMD